MPNPTQNIENLLRLELGAVLKPRPRVNIPAELLRLGYTLLCKNTSSDQCEHFEARQHHSGERVEVRVSRTDVPDPEFVAERMQMQWNVGRGLAHANLIRAIDGGSFQDGRAWLAVENLTGATLDQVLITDGPLSASRALHLARQLATALAVLHGRGSVHRCIRPGAVILVDNDAGVDRVKLTDLGVVAVANEEYERSREPTARRAIGNPHYLAPELARGLTADHRVDVYAFGALLYHALAGVPPFQADDPMDVIAMHVDVPAPDLGGLVDRVPFQVLDIIQRCMEKDPDARPQSMRAVERELESAERGLDGDFSISSAMGDGSMPTLPQPAKTAEWLRLSQRLELSVLSVGGSLPESVTAAMSAIDQARTLLANRREAAWRTREQADTAARHRIEGRHRLQRRARRMHAALDRYRDRLQESHDEVVEARRELMTLEDRYIEALSALRQACGPTASQTSMVAWGTRHMAVDDVLEARTVLAAALDAARKKESSAADALTALCAEEADLMRAFADQELEEQDEGFRLEQAAMSDADATFAAERALQRAVLSLLTHYVELSLHARSVA